MSTRWRESKNSDGLFFDYRKGVKFGGACMCPDNITVS